VSLISIPGEDVLEHILGNGSYSAQGGLAWLAGGLLQSGLDGVNWCVTQRAHGSGNKSDERSLVTWESAVMVLGLPSLEDFLEFGVGGEVDGLVGSYLFLAILISRSGFRSPTLP
jgi:hypothetical protein